MKLEQLMNACDVLNESDQTLLHFMKLHRKEIKTMNSQSLAAFCHVSRTTLLRVAQKLGLSTIFDLQMILQESEETIASQSISFANVCEIYHGMVDAIEKVSLEAICKLIDECDTIYVYGTGNEQKTIAAECKRTFAFVEKCVIEVFDYGEAEMVLATMQPKDLFLIISLSGETKAGIQVIELMKAKQVRTLSMTRLQNNTIARMCDHNMHVTTNMIATQNGYELVAGFYMLIDILFVSYLNYQQEVRCGTRKTNQ